eukprot:3966412-Pyramimonas_sp.AAC.1
MAVVWAAAGGVARRLGLPTEDLRRGRSKMAGDLLEESARDNGGHADALWVACPVTLEPRS